MSQIVPNYCNVEIAGGSKKIAPGSGTNCKSQIPAIQGAHSQSQANKQTNCRVEGDADQEGKAEDEIDG